MLTPRPFLVLYANLLSLPSPNLPTPLRALLPLPSFQWRVNSLLSMALQVIALPVKMGMRATENLKSKFQR